MHVGMVGAILVAHDVYICVPRTAFSTDGSVHEIDLLFLFVGSGLGKVLRRVCPFAIPVHPLRCGPCAAAAYCHCALCRCGMLLGPCVRPRNGAFGGPGQCRTSWVRSHQVE